MQNLEKLLIAPKQYKFYLIIHHCLNLIHGVYYCKNYLDNLINDRLPFTLAWFRCSFLFLIFILSLGASILYVLIIPQIITLNQQRTRDFINSFKLLLKQKLNTYMGWIEDIVYLLYCFGLGLMIWDILTTQEEEIQDVINSIRYQVTIGIVKYLIIKFVLEKWMQKAILQTEQNLIMKTYQLNEKSEIIQELCPICYDSFKSKEQIAQYLCPGNHKFHQECLMKWLQAPYNKRKSCPYCKQQPLNRTKDFL
ncbi:unnamed protein product (macronuclear) [Paramecium tetraurelia]|uniref:RING-type domain-containing protein n=1 Tax=Paramecium tetraurelia TaxID=5888 RepID=A0D9Q2_PARTE|nr:uncharacterized protein GSPATT00014700001 [Paramecium tetraurelia]CAK79769.1 unnamed protein product [Paramecium tetraurelia]|eukprot:XP_001447166.1 hypothetical protein (macronuclear) [Paramecium tetraurelia strain d4-2]